VRLQREELIFPAKFFACEGERQDAQWSSRPGARDPSPPTEGGVYGPVAQGSRWVADALLEIEQGLQIPAVLMNGGAVDVPNSVAQQQQRQ